MANNYTLFSTLLETKDTKELAWAKKRLKEMSETDDPDGGPGADFTYEFESEGIYIYSDESGNVDQVAEFLQEFLVEFRPDECLGMEWANTCSKARPGGFGGGAFFVTAKDIKYLNTGTWLSEQQEKFQG